MDFSVRKKILPRLKQDRVILHFVRSLHGPDPFLTACV